MNNFGVMQVPSYNAAMDETNQGGLSAAEEANRYNTLGITQAS